MPPALAAAPGSLTAHSLALALVACLAGACGDAPEPVGTAVVLRDASGSAAAPAQAANPAFPGPDRVAVPGAPAPVDENRPGNLLVLARFARDGRPARDVHLRLVPRDEPPGTARRPFVSTRFLGNNALPVPRRPARALACARVAADGVATFAGVPPGPYVLRDDRGGADVPLQVLPGVDTPLEYAVAPGVRVDGVVARPDGTPVAGAVVEVWWADGADDIETLATSDWAGRFRLDDVQPGCCFGVRAEEHFASGELRVGPGPVQTVRVELQPDACALDGFVVTGALQPIAGAVVWVGPGRGYGPHSLWARTDARGHFRLFGLDCDEHAVLVQADGFERGVARAVVETPAQFVLLPKPD